MSSPLASSSRHINLASPTNSNRSHLQRQQHSLRLLLAADSDSEDDCQNYNPLFLGIQNDDDDDPGSDVESDTRVMHRAKRARQTPCSSTLRSARSAQSRLFQSPTKRLLPLSSNTSTPSTPTKSARRRITIKGNVTPSRAFSIFKKAKANRATKESKSHHQHHHYHQHQLHGDETSSVPPLTPPPSSPAFPSSSFASTASPSTSVASLRHSQSNTPRRSTKLAAGINGFFSPNGIEDLPPATLLASTAAAPTPLAVRHLLASGHPSSSFAPSSLSVQDAIWSLKTRRSVGGWGASSHHSLVQRPRLNANSFLSTYVSPPPSILRLPLTPDGGLAHPLCSSYSYSSRSVHPSAQWLAVGDDQGRLSLLNTLPSQDVGAEQYSGTCSWPAVDAGQQESIFELAWRFDDRVILSGGSDYVVRSWDVEYQVQLDRFEAHRGSPRSIVWDPTTSGEACGNVFTTAGRDGAIHIWDARVGSRRAAGTDGNMRIDGMDADDEDGKRDASPSLVGAKAPVLSIWSAHTTATPRGKSGRASLHATPPASASSRSKKTLPTKGVTSLCYLPDGQGHRLVSAGCENGVLKCWDLRSFTSHEYGKVEAKARAKMADQIGPCSSSPDLTLLSSTNRRSHGISHLLASSTHIFASSTDGRIYNVPTSSFVSAPSPPLASASRRKTTRPTPTFGQADMCDPTPSSLFGLVTPSQGGEGGLYDVSQRQNTLYAKMALYNDRLLAVGCNTGEVSVWDISNPTSDPRSSCIEDDDEETIDEDELEVARDMGYGIAQRSAGSKGRTEAVVLRGGHGLNAEINSLSWCNGPMGPTVTSVGDDAVVRTWWSDREAREAVDEEQRERCERRERERQKQQDEWW